ncbi:MAG: hypothetical protein L6Q54_03280 [Leptospiraceae bacterium]|nr:hypothetical protein [Leptospiraceae bacterium]MCK6380259.1 hypothetical protein [Leptospiraceae bacterium]NUM40897.1 hypothetical protein [Leptospiraceae bacterium]
MKKKVAKSLNLESLYEKKITVLSELSKNLHRQMDILSYGDGEGAAKISFQNEKMIQKLDGIDEEIGIVGENSPQNVKMIFLSEKIFTLLEEIRGAHSKVTELFEKSVHSMKKELNTIQAKIQLKKYLRSPNSFWKTTIS